jgi:hypothetical protein
MIKTKHKKDGPGHVALPPVAEDVSYVSVPLRLPVELVERLDAAVKALNVTTGGLGFATRSSVIRAIIIGEKTLADYERNRKG